MNSLINYIIQSGSCFIIFYLIYFFLLKNETCFNYNRIYLFSSSILACVLPMLNFYALFDLHQWQSVSGIPVIQLPEFTLIAERPSPVDSQFNITLTNTLISFYFVGAIFFLIRFLIQLVKIKNIISGNRYNIKYWEGCNLINTNGKLPTFSFFNYLFWDNTITFNQKEKDQILRHELVHIREKHSYDVVYFQLLNIIFWFNPVISWYKYAITDVHEYTADHKAAVVEDSTQYAQLIVRQLFKRMDLTIGSYFNRSQTLRRLEMLKYSNKRANFFKIVLTLPLIGILIGIMGFNIEKNSVQKYVFDRENALTIVTEKPRKYKNLLYQLPEEKLPEILPKNQYDLIQPSPEATEEFVEDLIAIPGTNTLPGEIAKKGGPSLKSFEVEDPSSDDNVLAESNEIFTIVENQPTPIGGMVQFYKFIKKQLVYPKQARRMGIEGKVYVQFVIKKDGKIDEVKAIKGIGAGCDQEAERVIKLCKPWNPGKQRGMPVNVRMVIPITFKLG